MNLKNILLMFVISFCLAGNNVFASDNVLQAIQVDGFKDSYNIILKSDDVADLKKTVQAPNKMVLNLKGIRASKTINTIYNNTSSVDSVVVEPTGEDSVKISIQGENVGAAGIHFDTLKTPLGVLDKAQKQEKKSDELVLNGPMTSYKPVYNDNNDEEETGLSAIGASASKYLKKALKNEKISWMLAFGLFAVILIGGLKFIKGKDSDIRVGLTQSLKDREIDLYRNMGVSSEISAASAAQTNTAGANYGLKAYQQGTRSPYLSAESNIQQRPRPAVAPTPSAPSPTSINMQQGVQSSIARPQNQNIASNLTQGTMQNTMSKPAQPVSARPKSTNIDSMKFLESMTKIYEKNGRSDLAQGLKTNMKKAKMNLT